MSEDKKERLLRPEECLAVFVMLLVLGYEPDPDPVVKVPMINRYVREITCSAMGLAVISRDKRTR